MKNVTSIIDRFKIPTLLGLAIIISGIATGVFLTLRGQSFLSQAAPDATAQNIMISDISDTQAVVAWQTSASTSSFISYGQTIPNEQTLLDDRDIQLPKSHLLHYVTIKNLQPSTTYQFKITSGKTQSDIKKFTTASPLTNQTGFRPIIGSILDGNKPLDEGIVYLSIADAQTLSGLVKSGNFLIPINQIRKADLSDVYPLADDAIAKLTIVAGGQGGTALIKLHNNIDATLPPLVLGQDLDLTNFQIAKPASPSAQQLNKFDLNRDGKINAADNSLLLQNFGRRGKDIQGDLNGDGVVDQKDLDLMLKQINQ